MPVGSPKHTLWHYCHPLTVYHLGAVPTVASGRSLTVLNLANKMDEAIIFIATFSHRQRHITGTVHCHGADTLHIAACLVTLSSLLLVAGVFCQHNVHLRPLTPSVPAVTNCCCLKGTAPYSSNPPFLIFDIWALWCSGLSARVPRCQKLKMVG